MQQVMVSCYNIQFATADWIKRVKETVPWICGHEDDLIQDVIW